MRVEMCRVIFWMFLIVCLGACGTGNMRESERTHPATMQTANSIKCQLTIAKEDSAIMAQLVFTNSGPVKVPVLKRNLITDGLLTWSAFEIVRDGITVKYVGPTIKAASPTPDDFWQLMPGEEVRTVINLGKYYDLTARGSYTVRYRAFNPDPEGTKLVILECPPTSFSVP